MSGEETRECLLCLRTPLEKIRETVNIILPARHDNDTIDRISKMAAKLIATAYEKDRPALCGRKPSGIMASAIYIAIRMEKDVNISQGKVAKALGVTDVTLRTGVRQIKEILGLDIPKFPDRRDQYVCPFCEEIFTSLTDLKIHLSRNKIRPSSTLKAEMFNDDGILEHRPALERMKRGTRQTKRKTASAHIREMAIRKLKKEGRSPGESVPEPIMLLDKDKRRTG